MAALCTAGMFLSYRWGWISRASPERALELAQLAGVDDTTLAQLCRSLGVPLPAAVRARIPRGR
ncbi:hypothetical protein FGE12_25860 [Aggregicoccus sp. 17bor-14]|nr:hypothetical protein [Aggregicoccus sp. 17bor-14]